MAARSAAEVKISQDELKRQAAWKAVEYVKSGMVLGLGTGSTAAFAVDRIGQLLKDGSLTDIVGVPTSVRTYEQAKGRICRVPTCCVCTHTNCIHHRAGHSTGNPGRAAQARPGH